MIILDGATQNFEAVLGGAVATDQPEFQTTSGRLNLSSLDQYQTNEGELNDTTDVTLVAGVAGRQIGIKSISVFNRDSAAVTITFKKDISGVDRLLYRAVLEPDESVHYESGFGWFVSDANGITKAFVELNDLTVAVVWADVPDANITESAVVQHQAALTITESQISDLQHTVEVNDLTAAVVWADIPDANVPESAVTQHQAALSINSSQVPDFDATVAANAAVVANTAKLTNATHTGEVTGSGALTAQPTIISNQAVVTAEATDKVLLLDATDGLLKAADVTDFISAGPTALPALQARRAASFTLTTAFVDVTLDNTDVETDATVIEHNDANTDDVDIKVTGTYQVSWHANIDASAAGVNDNILAIGRVRLNDAGTEIPGSLGAASSFNVNVVTGNSLDSQIGVTFQINLTAGDKLTLQLSKVETGGAGTYSAEDVTVTVKKLETGQTGPAGPGVVNEAVQARRTTAYTLTTAFADVGMDATDVETDPAVIEHDNTNIDDIDIKVTGTYEIVYNLDGTTTAVAGDPIIQLNARVQLNGAGTGIEGSIANAHVVRDAIGGANGQFFIHMSQSFIVDLTASDFVTLQLAKTELSGSDTFEAENVSFTVKRLR